MSYEPPRDTIITARELVSSGFCVDGIKVWCGTYGFDFRDVLKNGISAKAGLATEDAMAVRAFELIMEKRNGQ